MWTAHYSTGASGGELATYLLGGELSRLVSSRYLAGGPERQRALHSLIFSFGRPSTSQPLRCFLRLFHA